MLKSSYNDNRINTKEEQCPNSKFVRSMTLAAEVSGVRS